MFKTSHEIEALQAAQAVKKLDAPLRRAAGLKVNGQSTLADGAPRPKRVLLYLEKTPAEREWAQGRRNAWVGAEDGAGAAGAGGGEAAAAAAPVAPAAPAAPVDGKGNGKKGEKGKGKGKGKQGKDQGKKGEMGKGKGKKGKKGEKGKAKGA